MPQSTRRETLSVAVIGGGMAGLTCARTLMTHPEHRFAVQVFDNGREPGGRTATQQRGGYQFDAGAQYFTVHDPRFQHAVDAWTAAGLVAEWNGRLCVLENGAISASEKKTRYVGVLGMSAVARHLASSCRVLRKTQVTHIHRKGSIGGCSRTQGQSSVAPMWW
jgi:renalase